MESSRQALRFCLPLPWWNGTSPPSNPFPTAVRHSAVSYTKCRGGWIAYLVWQSWVRPANIKRSSAKNICLIEIKGETESTKCVSLKDEVGTWFVFVTSHHQAQQKDIKIRIIYSIFRHTQLVYIYIKNVITGLLVSVSQNHLSGPPVLRTLLVYSCYKLKLLLKYMCIYIWCFHGCMGSHLQ